MPKTVRVRPSGHQFPVERAETILTAGLREGLNLDYHCGNGSCGECRARLLSGTVDSVCGSDFRFSPAEQARGYILTCCSTPSSDVEIEAHETGSAAEIPFQELDARIAKLERLSHQITLYEQGIIPQARQAAATSLADYSVGRLDFARLYQNQIAAYNAELALQEYLKDYEENWAALEWLVGSELPRALGGKK